MRACLTWGFTMPFSYMHTWSERVRHAIFINAHPVCIFLFEFVCFCPPLFWKFALWFWNSLAIFVILCFCLESKRHAITLRCRFGKVKLTMVETMSCRTEQAVGLWLLGVRWTKIWSYFLYKGKYIQIHSKLVPVSNSSSVETKQNQAVCHSHNPSTWEAEGGWLSWVQDHPGI